MKKLLLGIIIIAVAIGIYVISNQQMATSVDSNSGKPTIKIGVLLPLTGNLSNMGQSLKNGALLAIQDADSKNLKYNYELVIDDDRFEPKLDATIFTKQKSVDDVKAMVSFASTTGNILAPRADAAKIIYFNVGASDANVAKGKYTFIHWTQPSETTQKILEHQQAQGYKKVAFFAGNDAGVNALLKEYERQAPDYGLDIEVLRFNPDEKDFKMLLAKAISYNPDVYTALIWGGNVNPFIKQFNEANIDKPLNGIESVSMIDDTSILEGMYYADVAAAEESFNKHLAKNFPANPTNFAVGNMYDVINIIIRAFEAAETPDKAIDELLKIKEYNGVIGTATQDSEGIFRTNAVLKKIKNGKPLTVKE
ncbi:MAG: ABC transporter substrate-binding protein [Lactobacillus sp.]|jgi:branched-chain amino acid transport system substrate-binding protein|nr:ABC transporter substrate-binding protein [Lactobacillus sp.]